MQESIFKAIDKISVYIRENKKKTIVTTAFVLIGMMLISGIFEETKPERILLDVSQITFEDTGLTRSIGYIVEPSGAEHGGVQFVSQNEEIARFDGDKLTSVSEGETVIYAQLDGTGIRSENVEVKVADKNSETAQKAQAIIDKIDAISEVTKESGQAIREAETAYHEADSAVKEKVTNVAALIAARVLLTGLEEETKTNDESLVAEADGYGESTASSTGTVYIGKTGTKYHKKSCSTLKGKGTAISLSEAKAQGRTACKRCGG